MPQRIHSQIDTHNAHQAHFHSEKLSEHTTLLQSIATNTSETTINAGDLELHVDGLEALQALTNDKLDHLSSNIDTLNSNVNPVLNNIDGELEGQTVLLTTANSNTAHISDNLDHISSNLDTINANLNPALNNIEAELEEHKPIHEATNTKLDSLISANHSDIINTKDRIDFLITQQSADLHLQHDKTDHLSANLDTINSTLGDLATESTLQTIAEFNCDTTDVTITSSVLPAGAATETSLSTFKTANHNDIIATKDRIDFLITQQSADLHLQHDKTDHLSANLDSILAKNTELETLLSTIDADTNDIKTSVQLIDNAIAGNEMQVDVVSSALPSGAATQSTLNDAEVHLGSIDGKIALCNTGSVIIAASALPSGAATSALQAGGLPSALSSDNLKVSLKESIAVGVTNGPLTNLDATINSNRIDVNIAAGNISGFATATLQAGGLPSALSSDNLKVSLKETIDLPITNGALTELAAAINSDKVDVNISSGGFNGVVSGTVTANLSTTDNNVLDEIQTNGDNIQTKLDTMDSQIDLLEGANTIKDVSWLSSVSLSASSLSANLDTEGYKELTLYGKTTADHGSNLHIFGSSGDGVYFHISTLATSTVGGAYYIKEDTPLNLPNPRYFKIYNADSSTATITLRAT